MKKYWFKNRKIGIGWSPSSWQGWLIVGLYVISIIALTTFANFSVLDEKIIFRNFFAPFAALTFLLIIIAWRTGEPLDFRFWRKR